jgi:hypothetical protein
MVGLKVCGGNPYFGDNCNKLWMKAIKPQDTGVFTRPCSTCMRADTQARLAFIFSKILKMRPRNHGIATV